MLKMVDLAALRSFQPHTILSFLLRYYKKTGNERALEMVEKTLDAMHRGGMYDHIGFGFSRYSVDAKWLVPHFEKMLYDNALLVMTYIEAYQVTGKDAICRGRGANYYVCSSRYDGRRRRFLFRGGCRFGR